MKYVLWVLILSGCSSTVKVIANKCEQVAASDMYICECNRWSGCQR